MIKILRSRNDDRLHNIHEIIKINRVSTSILKNSRTLNYKRLYNVLIIFKSVYIIFAKKKNFKLHYINNYIN